MKKTNIVTNTSDVRSPDKVGGAISRQLAYQLTASHFREALEALLDVLHNGRQDSARISAANKIIDKVLPDLKATELTGSEGVEAIRIRIVEDTSLKDHKDD